MYAIRSYYGKNISSNKKIDNKIKTVDKLKTILIKKKIKDTYFTSNCDFSEKTVELKNSNINLNKPMFSSDSIITKGNMNLTKSLVAIKSYNFV